MNEIYFDNSSTTRPFDSVVERVGEVMREQYGNASSLHSKGIESEEIINKAKETLAGAIKVKPGELIFTSGGTESNNLAIKGIARKFKKYGKHIITSAVEHSSVLNSLQDLEDEGYEVSYLPVNEKGQVNPEDVEETLREDTILVSIMHVNNETGNIQPIDKIGQVLISHKNKPFFHVDAVQSLGKMPLTLFNSDIDLLSLSSHKIHGPKGVGALFIREGVRLVPLLSGGGQENGRRAGSENVHGIAGFSVALLENYESYDENVRQLKTLRSKLAEQIAENIPEVQFNTFFKESAPHILNVTFPGIKAEVLLRKLESEGVFVSTSSACNSRKRKSSHVLNAMGLSNAEVEGALRFSLSALNSEEEVDYCIEKLVPAYRRLLKMSTF